MKLKIKSLWSWIISHKIWSVIIILIIVGGFMFFGGEDKKQAEEFVLVETGTIKEQVSVTGNVKPLSEVDLAFERGGRVASLPAVVGDSVSAGEILASVSNADLVASVNQAKANLKKAQASLGSAADVAALNFSSSRSNLYNSIKDAYTKSDDALRNKIYSLFSDPQRYNSRLIFSTDSSLQEDIEKGKDETGEMLNAWSRSLEKLTLESNLDTYYQEAKTNLNSIKDLLDKSAEAVNRINTNDYTSQAQFETWKSNISTARTSINTKIDSLTADYNAFRSADLSVRVSVKDDLAEQAAVEVAIAQVQSAEAELGKTIIRSPIAGVITDVPIKLGEIVSSNQSAVSVISYGDYEIESFVPEADISKIKISNEAEVTLDAYGSAVIFQATVLKIDPAATVIDGVPTYKVTLKFVTKDERVRSGMTANLEINTAQVENALIIPARAVYPKDNKRFVKVVGADGALSEREVSVGLRGFDGRLEILSGLKDGEKVSTAL
jgi:RND family efflux transporter MFP subunit